MTGHAFSALIAFTLLVPLSFFVLLKGPRNDTSKYYFLTNFFLSIWVITSLLMWGINNKTIAIYANKICYLFVPLVPAFFVHLVYSIIGNTRIKRYLVPATYFVSILFCFLSPLPIFIKDVTPYKNLYFLPVLNHGYTAFIIYMYIVVAIAYTEMIIKAYHETGIEKTRLMYFVFATMIAFIGYSTFAFLMYRIDITWAKIPHDAFIIIYCIIFAYAIVRHQLMEIEVIIKKTLVFAGLLASVFAILVLPTLIIQEYLFRGAGTAGRLWGLVISGMIIILTVRRIENFLINITDKFLFQKKYDYKELLKTFANEVLTVLNIDVLVHTTVDRLSNIMKIQSCGMLLLNEAKTEYNLVASVGVDKNWKNITLSLDNTLASFLLRTKSHLSIRHEGKDSRLPPKLLEDMNKLKLELAIPLLIHDEMIGVLTLGKKKSDEDYTQDDMDILLPLARTLAISISNAMALDELSKTQAEAAQREKMAVIGTLSAGINHEICNPLGIARGQCEAFLLNIKDGLYKDKTPQELFEKAQKIMEKVIHETDRATSITKRLSSFAKPSKGIISDDVSIKDEIDEVLALVGYELQLDKIDIVKDIDENLPFISTDKKALQEVFFNLIRNAAQAMKERGKITIRARERDGKIHIDIEDTGHGIPEDKLDQIFNPFYTTKEPGKGTGLGLFIVRQVVEKNRGKIAVKSKVNEGTAFSLEFLVAAKAKV